MKVVLLCGGMGTRLREHTETRPKPMVEIGGRPILWHIMKTYAHYGLRDFVLCLGYKGHVIKDYFLNFQAMSSDLTVTLGAAQSVEYHNALTEAEDWKVTLADTGEQTQTGGRIAQITRYLDRSDTFAVTYGDGVANIPLADALAFHKAHGGLATVTGVRPPSRYGELLTAGDRVVAFSEKPQTGQGLINGGYFFFEPGFLEYLRPDADCVLEREPLERCAADGQLHVFEHAAFWQCMDTYRDWQRLETMWASDVAPWKVWSDRTRGDGARPPRDAIRPSRVSADTETTHTPV